MNLCAKTGEFQHRTPSRDPLCRELGLRLGRRRAAGRAAAMSAVTTASPFTFCEHCFSLRTRSASQFLWVSRETNRVNNLRVLGMSSSAGPAIFYHIHQGTYGMPGEPPGIYLLDAFVEADDGRLDHCLWSGGNVTSDAFAWSPCNVGEIDCQPAGPIDCIAGWGFEAVAAPTHQGDKRSFHLRQSGCTNATRCKFAGTRASDLGRPMTLVGQEAALTLESICVPCPVSSLGVSGIATVIIAITIAVLPTMGFVCFSVKRSTRRPSSAWPVRPRSPLSLFLFQLGWALCIYSLMPGVLWNLGHWWSSATASYHDTVILFVVSLALMFLVVRPDDGVCLSRAISALVLLATFFSGIFLLRDALAWWASVRGVELTSAWNDVWTHGFFMTWNSLTYLLCASCLLVVHVRIRGLWPRRWRQGSCAAPVSGVVLSQLWRSLRLAGLIFLLAQIAGHLATYMLVQHWHETQDVSANANLVYEAKVWRMVSLIGAIIFTSPRLRLQLHTCAGLVDSTKVVSFHSAFPSPADRAEASAPGTSVTRDDTAKLPSTPWIPTASGVHAASQSWAHIDLRAWKEKSRTDLGALALEARIGQGHYSQVYLGRAPGIDHALAVKIFRRGKYNDASAIAFLTSEVEVAMSIEHHNLVQAFGRVLINDVQPALVMEHMVGGSLAHFLHRRDVEELPLLTPTLQHRLALDVASGLCYLHNHQISHRDVKPGNVLLDGRLCAKLSDFGVSTRFGMETAAVGTLRYMAPEVTFGAYTYKADIYSFGMLLWELLHKKLPFAALSGVEVLVKVHQAARPNIGPLPAELRAHGGIISSCWKQMPTDRSDLDEVIRRLEEASPSLTEAGLGVELREGWGLS